MKKVLRVSFVIAWCIPCAWPQAGTLRLDNPVRLDSGLVAGTIGEVSVFKGIPYAAPPVGDLRWKAPQPVPHWEGIREAKGFGPACMQPGPAGSPGGMSEDCLTLNIWTPVRTKKEKLPVMVWIHGGGFTIGSTRDAMYDGAALARRGVVVVTLNYRLNIFGFFSHPQLSAESAHHTSGDYGLMDQIAALQWVGRNIQAFGGDPRRITIFGESAGGSSVCYLMISPLAKGLFQHAIAQSPGRLFAYIAHVRAQRYGLEPAEARGERIDPSITRLRAKSANEILALLGGQGINILATGKDFWPVVDGLVIPEDPARLFEEGRFRRVPMVVGTNAAEGNFFATFLTPRASVADYEAWARDTFLDFGDRVLQRYPAKQNQDVRPALARAFGGMEIYVGSYSVARAISRHNAAVWMYHFTRVNPLSPLAKLGATHVVEIPYVFENLSIGPLGASQVKYETRDQEIAAAMSSAWVRFAKTGNPNGGGLPRWPRYQAGSDQCLEFGDNLRVNSKLLGEELDFWSTIYFSLRGRPH